ncbi:hypothetical protein HCN44_010416 [Aphidius gifuensis]|uniref:Bro-N domain-containing protein n=1 Tax=Aphidius gifuensis TaxID=684658 RepID=A0A834XHQ9_APHGI|nr:hypothetical protein HCN44_010416 [Aphidius gifuensis]
MVIIKKEFCFNGEVLLNNVLVIPLQKRNGAFEFWFDANQIASILYEIRPRNAVFNFVNSKDKLLFGQLKKISNFLKKPEFDGLDKRTIFINEDGVLSLIFAGEKFTICKEFKYWFFKEIIPDLRRGDFLILPSTSTGGTKRNLRTTRSNFNYKIFDKFKKCSSNVNKTDESNLECISDKDILISESSDSDSTFEIPSTFETSSDDSTYFDGDENVDELFENLNLKTNANINENFDSDGINSEEIDTKLMLQINDVANKEIDVVNKKIDVANEEIDVANEEIDVANKEIDVANEEIDVANEEIDVANEEINITDINDDLTTEINNNTEMNKMNVNVKYKNKILETENHAKEMEIKLLKNEQKYLKRKHEMEMEIYDLKNKVNMTFRDYALHSLLARENIEENKKLRMTINEIAPKIVPTLKNYDKQPQLACYFFTFNEKIRIKITRCQNREIEHRDEIAYKFRNEPISKLSETTEKRYKWLKDSEKFLQIEHPNPTILWNKIKELYPIIFYGCKFMNHSKTDVGILNKEELLEKFKKDYRCEHNEKSENLTTFFDAFNSSTERFRYLYKCCQKIQKQLQILKFENETDVLKKCLILPDVAKDKFKELILDTVKKTNEEFLPKNNPCYFVDDIELGKVHNFITSIDASTSK